MFKKILLISSLLLPFSTSALEYKGWTLQESMDQEGEEYTLLAIKGALTSAFMLGNEASAIQSLGIQCSNDNEDHLMLILSWDTPMAVDSLEKANYEFITTTWKIGHLEAFQTFFIASDDHAGGVSFLELIPLPPAEWLNEKTWVFSATSASGQQGTAIFDVSNLDDVLELLLYNCKVHSSM